MFHHSDTNEKLEFKAAHLDGSSLPKWLHFDPKTLKFEGLVPKGAHDERIMVTVRDVYGNEAHVTFKVYVERERMHSDHKPAVVPKGGEKRQPGERSAVTAKIGLSDQVHAVGKLSKLQESRALLESLKQL